MIRPTLRQLEYAVAVADHRSFHEAAAACAVSQPGLSVQLRELEIQLGVQLFERDRRRVLITPEGEEVVARARAILLATDEMVEAARVLATPMCGDLRLGVIPTVAPYLLPEVLPVVRKEYPGLRLLLREDHTDRLLARLDRGELDLLLLALEAPLGDVETLPLFRDPFVVAMARSHPLAKKPIVSQRDVAGADVLLLEDGHCLRQQALEVCTRAGAPEAGDFRAGSLATLIQMVVGGMGITLLPSLCLELETRRERMLAVSRFRRPVPHRTIGLAWRRTSPRGADFRRLADTLVPRRFVDAGSSV
jgi:LysR family hydrogen peroxide-inducible transcriptional activator